jgi:hypothetical protein
MKKFFKIGIITMLTAGLFACGSNKKAVKQTQADSGFQKMEVLLSASSQSRPDWTLNEPESVGTNMFFVGLSEKSATEKLARDEARRNAAQAVVNYLGTSVKDKFQEITARFGLSSEISDPTKASKGFVDTLSAGLSKKMKITKWYIEKWQTRLGQIYYKVYGLGRIPKSVIDDAFKDSVDKERSNLKDKIKKENNAQAKTQLEDTLRAFDALSKNGFTE